MPDYKENPIKRIPGALRDIDFKVSLFAVPKPFRDHIAVIQHNALASWKQLGEVHEIILLGDELGTRQAAESTGAIHYPQLRVDQVGTPLLDDIFRVARGVASSDWLCYVNADIILMPDFGQRAARAVAAIGQCLIVSQRWNLDIKEQIDFRKGWVNRLRERASRNAELFSPFGIDVFVFHRDVFEAVPPFALGRSFWDNWLVFEARQRGYAVVDLTANYSVIHQNHDYDGFGSMDKIRRSQQGLRNFWLAGDSGFKHGSIRDATHRFEKDAIVPSKTKSVSVVIPHAGSLAQLRKTLRALSHQNYPRSFVEVIVVENSDYSTAAAAVTDFPFIKLTRELKRGPAAARNKGAAIAQGDIIAFLDSDCCPAGDWIEQGVATVEQHNLNCVVACNIKPGLNHQGSAGVRWYEAITFHEQKHYVEKEKACITGGMFVPKQVWLSVGPFDEDFPEAACEDWDWSTRASGSGVPITYAAAAVVTHPVHCSWSELRAKSLRLARGEILLARKNQNTKLLRFGSAFLAYTKRLRQNLRSALSDQRVPFHLRVFVALAATRVWYWSVRETHRALNHRK